jgi:hypothetical protein
MKVAGSTLPGAFVERELVANLGVDLMIGFVAQLRRGEKVVDGAHREEIDNIYNVHRRTVL